MRARRALDTNRAYVPHPGKAGLIFGTVSRGGGLSIGTLSLLEHRWGNGIECLLLTQISARWGVRVSPLA